MDNFFEFTLPLAQSALLLKNDVPGALLTSKIGEVTWSGVIAKNGIGPVVMAKANAHSGGTHVYAGELRATVTGSLGSGPTIQLEWSPPNIPSRRFFRVRAL